MQLLRCDKQIVMKVIAAGLLLSLMACIAGTKLVPHLPLHLVIFYSALGAVIVLITVVILTVATLTFSQFILRKGGTDAQWFWFAAEPPGLVRLRQQAGDGAHKDGP